MSVIPYDAVRARARFVLRCALAAGMALAILTLWALAGRMAGRLWHAAQAVLELVLR